MVTFREEGALVVCMFESSVAGKRFRVCFESVVVVLDSGGFKDTCRVHERHSISGRGHFVSTASNTVAATLLNYPRL